MCDGERMLQNQFKIETDCSLNPDFKKDIKLKDIENRPSELIGRFYRDDIAIFQNHVPVNTILFYPVLTYEIDEFVEEDIPVFETYTGKVTNTKVLINPFPWFHSQIIFYPNAHAIYGILDMWLQVVFQKYYPRPF